jgi:hypothetical protein
MEVYKRLKKISKFQDSFSPANFAEVPHDWYVIITDVISSTKAIEAGRYKDVNIAGGLSVVALANQFKDMDFPFVFGGDGVTFLIPPAIISEARDGLIDTKLKVKDLFNLDLRIGIVPVVDLIKAGKTLQIAKLAVSQYYDQAIINGSGADTAEAWIKKPGSPYLVDTKLDDSIEASFQGFTCRWQDVRSSEGETIAIIVKVREAHVPNVQDYYESLVPKIMAYAGDERKHHPIKHTALKTTGGKYLKNEAKAITLKKNGLRYFFKLLSIHFERIAGNIIIALRLPAMYGYYKVKDMRNYNVISSDYRKYDGTLKMVLSVSTESREKIEALLRSELEKKNIYYGIHISDRALLTCLLHVDSTREVHFVDAADGGYALAALQMKKQIQEDLADDKKSFDDLYH